MPLSARQALDAYDTFALIYNRTSAEDFCTRAWPIVEKLLLTDIPSGARILDLCCGSGQMARELSNRGYRVVGLDTSEQMIQLACQNARAASFFLADARRFSLSEKFDAVLCSFNSLAHASSVDELRQVFGNVRAVLKTQAPMLFDLSMEEAYASKWRDSFGDAQNELAWIIRPSYTPDTRQARNDVTLFQREDGMWHRHDFAILQKCHSEAEIRAALSQSGFAEVRCYDAERDLHMSKEAGRLFFLCQ